MPALGLTEPKASTPPQALQAPPPQSSQAPSPQSSSARPSARPNPQDDFIGLDYSAEQKAEIEKIHRRSIARREAIVRDAKLSPETKDAMISGYGRIEYGEMYKILTPEQQTKVRDKIRARREADKYAHKGQQAPYRPMPTH